MRKFSRKQIGAVGLAVMMSAQGPGETQLEMEVGGQAVLGRQT